MYVTHLAMLLQDCIMLLQMHIYNITHGFILFIYLFLFNCSNHAD